MKTGVIINGEGFENNINSFEKNVLSVKESLNKISILMQDITGDNETWKSETGVAVHEKFTEVEKGFENINTELDNFTKFLKSTIEKYKEEETKLEQSVDSQSSNFDVNE